jgi:hypothetical protein
MGRKRSNCEYGLGCGGAAAAAAAAAPGQELRLWARYDSRPLLKAKEPRGRAESESRRKKCVILWGGGAARQVSACLAICLKQWVRLAVECKCCLCSMNTTARVGFIMSAVGRCSLSISQACSGLL